MQGNYVKLMHPLASDLRKRPIEVQFSGSFTPEHYIDSHTIRSPEALEGATCT